MPALDTVLAYLFVFLAAAFMARPVLYRLIGRQAPSAACHSDRESRCHGGCSGCPVGQSRSAFPDATP